MIDDVMISNNSKHNNCSNHKPLTGLQYDNNQTAIPKLLLIIIYFSSMTIITISSLFLSFDCIISSSRFYIYIVNNVPYLHYVKVLLQRFCS